MGLLGNGEALSYHGWRFGGRARTSPASVLIREVRSGVAMDVSPNTARSRLNLPRKGPDKIVNGLIEQARGRVTARGASR